jgi:hypothetical protein
VPPCISKELAGVHTGPSGFGLRIFELLCNLSYCGMVDLPLCFGGSDAYDVANCFPRVSHTGSMTRLALLGIVPFSLSYLEMYRRGVQYCKSNEPFV